MGKVAQELFVSCWDGGLYRLDKGTGTWIPETMLCLPRYMHQMLPWGEDATLILGGDSKLGHLAANEVVKPLFLRQPPQNGGRKSPRRELRIRPSEEKWSFPNLSSIRSDYAACKIGNRLVFYGGSIDDSSPDPLENLSSEALTFDLASMQLHSGVAPPYRQKSMQTIVVEDGPDSFVIGFGGLAEEMSKQALDFLVFHPYDATWQGGSVRIPQRRWLFKIEQFQNETYLFGGFSLDEATGKQAFTSDVLVFNPSKKPHAFVPTGITLSQPRFSHSTATIDHQAYIVGGYRSPSVFAKSGFEIDLVSKECVAMPSPLAPRANAQLIAFKGRLYLAGGVSPNKKGQFVPNKSVECYDPVARKWKTIVSRLSHCHKNLRLFALEHRVLCASIEGEGESRMILSTINPPDTQFETSRAVHH
ncbi:MAG: hypothetical protein VXZ82_21175 [Planctomycetota bacterium]|nr:hypothetical protein [Planctomycetota bacterium]